MKIQFSSLKFYCNCSLQNVKSLWYQFAKKIFLKINFLNRDTETCRKVIVFSVDGTGINLCHRKNSTFSAFRSYSFISLHWKNIYMHAKTPMLNVELVTLKKKCMWEWTSFNFSLTYKTVLLACQVLAKQENKNSELKQDCIQFKLLNM